MVMKPAQPKGSGRAFTLLDAMVLVAALAAGFGAVRGWVILRSWIPQFDNGNLPPRLSGYRDAYTAFRLVLLLVTLAILPLSLRRPRPPLRDLWGRPGTVVPVAVALSLVACLADEGAFQHLVGFYYLYASPTMRLFNVVTQAVSVSRAATAVVVAWSALALAGRWKPEASWVGRLGRALGFAWVGSCLGYRAYELAMYWLYRQVVI
jgi:hypothetical protein